MQNTYTQNSRSQNGEDLFVLNYFGDYKGVVLEIGANDGLTLSNSRLLIQNGWKALLCEPGDVVDELQELYKGNESVIVCPFGIGISQKEVKFWQSGAHVPNGTDRGLVSTTILEETKRWPRVEFIEKKIQLFPFSILSEMKFDFISIDTEGNELEILHQIDLDEVGCLCLCIEWNSNPELGEKFQQYCGTFGMKLAVQNAENQIYVR